MDQKPPDLPEIKPDVQKEEDEKKRGGFLASLWSKLSGGGAGGELGLGGGAGGFGGLGGLGGAGVAGGLLATKAGLIGLIMIGTTVAGGLGFLGYKAFGPGDADRAGGTFNLFAAKPPAPAGETAEVSKNGDSRSLDMFVAGNAAPSRDGSADAKKDETADAAAAPAASNASPAANAANVGGNKATLLKTDRKFGELTKLGAAGSAGSTSVASSAGSGALPATAVRTGALSPIGKGRSALGSQRGLRRNLGGGNAFRELGQVRRDQAKAPSSQGAGTTYDGGRAGSIGPDAGAPGVGGAGTGDGAGVRSNPTNATEGSNRFPEPPGVAAKNVTPWQSAINMAMMAVAAGAMALMAAAKLAKAKTPQTATMSKMLCAVAALLAMIAIAMGSMIASGKYGQKMQGNMFMLAGGALIAAAGTTWMGLSDPKSELFKSGAPTGIMMISGAAAVGAALIGFLQKPMKVDSSYFNNGKPPDFRLFSSRGRYSVPSRDGRDIFFV